MKHFEDGGGLDHRKGVFPLHFPEMKLVTDGLRQDLDFSLNGVPTTLEELDRAKPFKKSGGPVFLDGSCLDGDTCYARTAGALVQLGPD